MNNKTKFQQSRTWLVMLLLLAGSITSYGQSECFTYDKNVNTIITGLTGTGQAATSLTIPKEVTVVNSEAFSSASNKLTALVIEAGGNPVFEGNLFGGRTNPLGQIDILSSNMTVANISALFSSLVGRGALQTVYIAGYSGVWSDIAVKDVLTNEVSVSLPAAMVTTQQFGDAQVCGRFEITKEIITFCGNVTFQDTDNGSNMLFYRADGIEDGRLHIMRVDYVVAGQGILIHNRKNTSTYADLPRYSEEEDVSYTKNMLVGVIVPTTIGRTDGDKTNYILSNGAFHPTNGGTIGANKAYLQVPTAVAANELTIDFDEETTGVAEVGSQKSDVRGEWYDLQGRKVTQPTKGLYIMNGKKYVIR